MYCIKCGTQLPDDAQFCFSCGTKINNSPSIKHAVDEKIDTGKKIRLTVFGKEFEYSDKIVDYAKIRHVFQKNATDRANDFIYNADAENIDDIISKAIPTVIKNIHESVELGVQTLISYGVYHIDYDELQNRSYNRIDPSAYFKPYFESMEKIENMVSELQEYRTNQRASRSYWSGGGFGVKGAIKGALTAGAMNIGMNALYGIENAIQNSSDRNKITKAKEEAFDEDYTYDLADCIEECCFNVFFTVLEILDSEGILQNLSIEVGGKEEAALNNMRTLYEQKKLTDKNQICNQISICIAKNPFNFEAYDFWASLYVVTCNKREIDELRSFAQTLSIEEEIELKLTYHCDKYCGSIAKQLSENTPIDRIDYYISQINLLKEKCPNHPFLIMLTLNELKKRPALIEEKKAEIEEEWFSFQEIEKDISNFELYMKESSINIWSQIEKKNGVFEYLINHYFQDIYCKWNITNFDEKGLEKKLHPLTSIKSANTNFYEYLVSLIEYDFWDTRTHSETSRRAKEIRDYATAKNACSMAQAMTSFIYNEKGNVRTDIENIKKACKQKNPLAIAVLGDSYYTGDNGFEQDIEKGKLLLQFAASLGVPFAASRARYLKIPFTERNITLSDEIITTFHKFIEALEKKHKEEAEKKKAEEQAHLAEKKAAEDALIAEREAKLQAKLAEQEACKKKELEELNIALEQAKDEYNSLLQRQETTEKELFSSSSLLRFVKTLVIILQGSAFLAAIVGVIWMLIAKGFWWMVLSVIISFVMLVIVLSVSESIFKAVKRFVNREKANELEALNKEVEEKKKALDALENQLL